MTDSTTAGTTPRTGDEIPDGAIVPYSAERDLVHVQRIWTETGWASSDEHRAAMEPFFAAGTAEVGMLDGEAEAATHRSPGVIRYQEVDLPLCAITAVTTSRVARRNGFASRLTANALAAGAAEGAAVAALGMFEQGFYDRFGFGTAGYQVLASFDPASLRVDAPYRRPVRLGPEDWAEVHQALRTRKRVHGGIALDPPGLIRAELAWESEPFVLGYRTGGELTHFVGGSTKGESGPYSIHMVAYRTGEQLLELLRLLSELGDQVATISMPEPAEIQLQDLLAKPLRARMERLRSEHEVGFRAVAWWQFRILDVGAAVAARSWPGDPVEFNLRLRDPLLDLPASSWDGIGGDFVVRIADLSSAEAGRRADLPTLDASVGAFSRCWFGVKPASGLALTDDLAGPPELLAALDGALAVGPPVAALSF